MTGNTIYHDRLIIALNQWFNIVDKIFGHIICILVHPASRNQLLFIGDSVYIVNSGSCHIWIVRYTVDDYHLAGVSFICCLYGCTANHHSLINIHAGCHMGSASLKSGKLYGTGLTAALCCQEIRQISSCSLKLLVSKCIYVIPYTAQLADIASVSQLDSFRYCNDNRGFFLKEFFYFGKEFIYIKWNFRKIDQIRSITVLRLGKCSGTCKPACITSHDFIMVIMFFL